MYTLVKKKESVEIQKKLDFTFKSGDKHYRVVIQVSKYKGVQVEIEVEVPLKTLYSNKYIIYYTITSSLLFRKEYIIETCSFSFEIFANYKFAYTLFNKEPGSTYLDKVIVYPDGQVFGGQKICKGYTFR